MINFRKAFLSLLLAATPAFAAVDAVVTPGDWALYRGTSIASRGYATEAACVDAAKALNVARSYTCRTSTGVAVTITPDVCPAQPAAETQAVQCPAGTAGSWQQSRIYVAAPFPTCWTAGAWSPAAAPAGACASPPPSPPVASDLLAPLLPFAETWARNWNFGGHAVDARFTENYGLWDYIDTTYEPWLFDRATVGYRLFQMTGDARWRAKFLSDFAWYRARIDAAGIFTPKGYSDTKYSYVTPFVLYERETGDAQYRTIAKRIYDVWLAEWPDNFDPGAALWTEREIAFALEAAVSWYELTQDAGALARSRALVAQWTVASGSVGAPQVSYTRHEGGGPGGTTPQNPVNSPWMTALYFQAARRLADIDPPSIAAVQAQVSKYADFCEANCYYDAAVVHPQYAGLTFPRYLTGDLIGEAQPDYSNMAHCVDVAGVLFYAIKAKQARGESTAAASTRLAQMKACAIRDVEVWTRDTTYLPKYRLSPPRKFNWQVRGLYELSR